MQKNFDKRPWYYWVILLFITGETLFAAFRLVPYFTAISIGHQPEAAMWEYTPPFIKTAALSNIGVLFTSALVVILLLMRRRFAFKAYLVVVIFAIPALLYRISLIDADMATKTMYGAVGSVIGSLVQFILMVWGLYLLCRKPVK